MLLGCFIGITYGLYTFHNIQHLSKHNRTVSFTNPIKILRNPSFKEVIKPRHSTNNPVIEFPNSPPLQTSSTVKIYDLYYLNQSLGFFFSSQNHLNWIYLHTTPIDSSNRFSLSGLETINWSTTLSVFRINISIKGWKDRPCWNPDEDTAQ